MIEWNAVSITFVALFLAQWLVVVYLETVNIRHIKSARQEVPKGFEGFIDGEKLKQITAYTIENAKLGLLSKTITDLVLLGIIVNGLLNSIDSIGSGLHSSYLISGPIFFVVITIVFSVLDLPFGYYGTFVLEEKYGFNRTTLKLWIVDHIKSWLLTIILISVVAVPVLWTIQSTPTYWWFYGFLVVMIFELCVTVLYPVLIAPLFNKFEPLKDEELTQKLIDLVQSANLKPGRILQMDAGKRSTHSNAYFTGLGKTKRIVLFDTLLNSHSHEEIVAVLAHEIGHYKGKHIVKSFVLSSISLLIGFYLTYHLMNWNFLHETFRLEAAKPYLALFIIGILWQRAGYFLRPLGLALSRYFERQADAYAVKLTKTAQPMASALKGLARHNLANLTPHPLYVWFNYSHPPIVERVKLIESQASN